MTQLTSRDHVFDGFMHRPFNEHTDGWMNKMPELRDYPAVENAAQVLDMWDEIRSLRRKVW